jgi:hypothetical protein
LTFDTRRATLSPLYIPYMLSTQEPGAGRWLLALAVAAVLLSRVVFVPQTLEDLDSTNFARALVEYNPVHHRPHPPGYPVYVALAKIAQALVPGTARSLAALSAVAQALLLLALLALFRSLAPAAPALTATLLAITTPALWFNGARPMSDSVGLLFIVSTQALLLQALRAPRLLALASLLVGLAPGARLQSVFLTLPLWLYVLAKSPGRRARAGAAAAAGVLAWFAPLLYFSGGPAKYLAAFSDTLGQAAAFEPLLSDFTLNRAAHTLRLALLGPWAQPSLGMVMLGLSLAGFFTAAWRRPDRLGLALLAFAPYFVVHLLLQHVETLRYTLPYVPLFAYLAAEAFDAVADRLRLLAVPARLAPAALAAWAAALTLPALQVFASRPSPPYAALQQLVQVAQPPQRFAVAGHYVFGPYVDETNPWGLDRLFAAKPGGAVARLREFWLGGGRKDILFVAQPGRTDLESIDARSRLSIGDWRWPFDGVFLTGARPMAAELLKISPPGFFAGPGFLLSLEAGKPSELPRFVERRAWLRAAEEPTFLIVAGEPIGPAAQHRMELSLAGEPLYEHACGEPLLKGFQLPARDDAGGYLELVARTRRGVKPEGVPFALRGLDYAPSADAGYAHGAGWFYPEADETKRPFRWAGARARSLVHVPERGARLVVSGRAPLEYVGNGGRVQLFVDGQLLAQRVFANEAAFQLEVPLPGGTPFREVLLQSERAFVPDRLQRNGDRRRLALRVYSFRVSPL